MTDQAPDFLMIPYALIADERINPVDQRVYGVIYWYTRLKLERCIAANPTIAKYAATTPHMVQKSLATLEQCGYIRRVYADEAKRQREEIVPLLVFGVSPTGHGGYHPQVTRVSPTGDQKKKIKEEDIQEKNTLPAVAGKDVSEFIDLFKEINAASYRLFFMRKPQREAAARLLEMHPLPWWTKFMEAYKNEITNRYCPKATSPVQLEANLSRIIIYAQANKAGEGKYDVGRV